MQAYPICNRCGCRLRLQKKQQQFKLWCPECKTVFVRFCAPMPVGSGARLEAAG